MQNADCACNGADQWRHRLRRKSRERFLALCDLDEASGRNRLFYGLQRETNDAPCIAAFPGECERNPSPLANADCRVITTGLYEPFDKLFVIAVLCCKLIFEGENIFQSLLMLQVAK